MSHHTSSVNGEGTSHKDPLSRIFDELSSLKLRFFVVGGLF